MAAGAAKVVAVVVGVAVAEPEAMLAGLEPGVVADRGVGAEQAAATKLTKPIAVIFAMSAAYTAAYKLFDRNSAIAMLPLYSDNALRDA